MGQPLQLVVAKFTDGDYLKRLEGAVWKLVSWYLDANKNVLPIVCVESCVVGDFLKSHLLQPFFGEIWDGPMPVSSAGCIQFGNPMLIENVQEADVWPLPKKRFQFLQRFDTNLDPLTMWQCQKIWKINPGDTWIHRWIMVNHVDCWIFVHQETDPAVEPVLLRQTFKKGSASEVSVQRWRLLALGMVNQLRIMIRLGEAGLQILSWQGPAPRDFQLLFDFMSLRWRHQKSSTHCLQSTIEWAKSFKFYLTTKLRNPHYLPEARNEEPEQFFLKVSTNRQGGPQLHFRQLCRWPWRWPCWISWSHRQSELAVSWWLQLFVAGCRWVYKISCWTLWWKRRAWKIELQNWHSVSRI